MARDHERLVIAFMAHAESVIGGAADDSPFWAWDAVTDIVRKDPEAAWPLVLRLVAAAQGDRALAYVAAGPLEDLLCWHGPVLIARVEQQAERDARFRRAITGVWGWSRMPEEIQKRLERCVGSEPRL